MKDLCQKWKVKLIFEAPIYRLPGTGIVECLECTDVECNLKQFYDLTRLTLTPRFYDRSTPLELMSEFMAKLGAYEHHMTWIFHVPCARSTYGDRSFCCRRAKHLEQLASCHSRSVTVLSRSQEIAKDSSVWITTAALVR